jgi:hypothetical protein
LDIPDVPVIAPALSSPVQSVELARALLADPWYGPVLRVAFASEVAAAGLRGLNPPQN